MAWNVFWHRSLPKIILILFFQNKKRRVGVRKEKPNQQLHDMLFIWSEYKESCNGSKQHDKK